MPCFKKDFEGQSQFTDLNITNNSVDQMSPNFDLSITIDFSVLLGDNKLPLRMYRLSDQIHPESLPQVQADHPVKDRSREQALQQVHLRDRLLLGLRMEHPQP
jgi:DNA-directed RNA polymerase delta subunit